MGCPRKTASSRILGWASPTPKFTTQVGNLLVLRTPVEPWNHQSDQACVLHVPSGAIYFCNPSCDVSVISLCSGNSLLTKMSLEAAELCAMLALLTQNRTALLGTGGIGARTASAPNSVKVSFVEVECLQRLSCSWHRLLFCGIVLESTPY